MNKRKQINVGHETYSQLVTLKGKLESKHGRIFSLEEVILYLLEKAGGE